VGTKTYAEEGNYATKVTIADGSSTATVSGHVRVLDAPLIASGASLTATEGASFNGNVARFVDLDPNGHVGLYSAVINWGDGQTSTGTVAANGTSGFVVKGNHTFATTGPHTFLVMIADKGGSTVTTNGVVIVKDAALTAISSPITANSGTTFKGV